MPAPEPAQRSARYAEPPGFPADFTHPSYPREALCQAPQGPCPAGPRAGRACAGRDADGPSCGRDPLWGGETEPVGGCCRRAAGRLRRAFQEAAAGVPPRVAILPSGRSHFDAPVIRPPITQGPDHYAGSCEGPESRGRRVSRMRTRQPLHFLSAHCRASGTSTTFTPSGGEKRKRSSPRPPLMRTSSKATRVTFPTRSKTAVSRTSPVAGSTRTSRCS